MIKPLHESIVLKEPPRHLLALLPNWLGDVAMCTPALRALHLRFPEAQLHVAGRAAACALLDGAPWITSRITLPSKPGLLDSWRMAKLLAPVAEISVVFPHSFRAALLARLAHVRGRGRIRLGYDRGSRAFLLTHPVPPHFEKGTITPVYMSREYLDLVAPLGCADDNQGLELHADLDELTAVRPLISAGGPVIGIAPGAAFGPSKRWPAERYAAVADALQEQTGARVVLITGPGEEDTRDAVRAAARSPLIDCTGGQPTVARLKATIASLDLLIGNDSGPRHVAVAFGVPVICIMGPTSPRYTDSPWEKGTVMRRDVYCGPCQRPVCTTDHRCMRLIEPTDVVRAALAHLRLVTISPPRAK